MTEAFQNDFSTTLTAAISTTDGTSVSVAAGFAVAGQYRVRVDSEILIVTAGADTTTATHDNGVAVTHVLTAGGLVNHVNTKAATYSNAVASPPAVPITGDIWLPSDGRAIKRYNGSSWDSWGVLQRFGPVDAASAFTWDNQAGATLTDESDGTLLLTGAASATNHAVYQAMPASRGLSVGMDYTLPSGNYSMCGVGFRDSASGKYVIFRIVSYNGVINWFSTKYTNVTTESGNYGFAALGSGHTGRLWVRMLDDGINRKCSYSGNGTDWTLAHSVGRADFITGDQIALWIAGLTGGTPTMRVFQWIEGV
jgi:hypothetical protein